MSSKPSRRRPARTEADWIDWVASASSDAIIASRSDWQDHLRPPLAWALRNRAAALLLTSPRESAAMADAMLAAIDAAEGPSGRSKRSPSCADQPRTDQASDCITVRALSWRTMAEADTYLGRLKEARRNYERASTHAERVGDDRLLGEILVGRIGVLNALGDPRVGSLVDEAKSRLERAGHTGYLARLHMNLGSAAFHREDPGTAYREFRAARRIFQQLGTRDATSMSLLVNLGSACTELLRLSEAREVLREAERFGDEEGLAHLAAHARLDLSFVDRLEGRYREALSLLERAEGDFEAVGATDLKASTQLTRAEIKLELGLATESFAHAREAATAFEEQEKTVERDHALIVQGRSLVKLGRYTPARRIFESLLDGAIEQGWKERIRTCLLDLAQIEVESRRPERALERLRSPVLRSRSIPLSLRGEIVLGRAEAQLALGYPARADRSLEQMAAEIRGLPLRTQRRYFALSGRVARENGDYGASRRALDRAVLVSEQIRETIPGVELRAAAFQEDARIHRERVESEVTAVLERMRIAEREPGSIRVTGRSGSALVNWTRRARARSHRERRERSHLPNDLIRLRAEIGQLSRLREESEFDPNPDTDAAELNLRIGRLESRFLREFRRWEAKLPARGETGDGEDGSSAALEHDGVKVVEYYLAAHTALATVVTTSQTEVHVLPAPAEQIVRAVETLRFQVDSFIGLTHRNLAHPGALRRTADAALRTLHELLIAPLLPSLGGASRLRIVPHSVLHHVPFGLLFDGKAYLGDEFEVEISVSGSPVALSRRKRRALLAANLAGGPAQAEAEVRGIERQLGERATVQLAPTVDEFLSGLRRGSVVHLATHGTFRDDNPLFTRLTLSDRSLFVSDLASFHLDTDLLVLSTCDSGRTFGGQGDDLQGLAHAFLSSGVRRLVASLWRVDDRATQHLMESFYRHLFGGPRFDPTSALGEAATEVRASWPHPFLWGAFAVYAE
ncbi:MAG: CHAT domain-containing protein [Candidatus Eisenbacteria bacterium]